MYDLQRIGKIVADIQKHIGEVKSYKINSVSDLQDSKNYNASSMAVFAILNKAIDLGGEIISAENLGAPNRYTDIMPMLSKAGVMNKETSERLNRLIRQRNTLAHFYDDITEKELLNIIKEISAVEDFVKLVKKRVKFD